MSLVTMSQRYPADSAELRIYERFKVICTELSHDIRPHAKCRRQPALVASNKALREAGIALLEAQPISSEDWPFYLEQAFCAGDPPLLSAALCAMPCRHHIIRLQSLLRDLVTKAPIEHILIAVQAGIIDLCLTKELVQAAITRESAPLQDAIIAHVEQRGASYSASDWFGGLRAETLRKGADFLATLLKAYVTAFPADAARGLMDCADRNRPLHGLALHLAGARLPDGSDTRWNAVSNHRMLTAIGGSPDLARLLRDPAAPRRASALLAA